MLLKSKAIRYPYFEDDWGHNQKKLKFLAY